MDRDSKLWSRSRENRSLPLRLEKFGSTKSGLLNLDNCREDRHGRGFTGRVHYWCRTSIAPNIDEMSQPAAWDLGTPNTFFHVFQQRGELVVHPEQPNRVYEQSNFERVLAADGSLAATKGKPVIHCDMIDKDCCLAVPDHMILKVFSSPIRDDFADPATRLLFSVLPEVLKGPIHGMFCKQPRVPLVKLCIPLLTKDPQIHHRAIGCGQRIQ